MMIIDNFVEIGSIYVYSLVVVSIPISNVLRSISTAAAEKQSFVIEIVSLLEFFEKS